MDSLVLPGPFRASVWVAHESTTWDVHSWSSRNFSPRPQAYHQSGCSAYKASTRQKEPPGRAWEPWGGDGSAAGRCGQSCLRRQGWGRRGQILVLEQMLKAEAWQALGGCGQCAGAEGHALPPPSAVSPSIASTPAPSSSPHLTQPATPCAHDPGGWLRGSADAHSPLERALL